MKHSKKELDAIINDVTREIRDEQIDSFDLDQSAARVWARINTAAENPSILTSNLEGINTMNIDNNTEQINGCEDFQSLIPAYLNKQLSTARTLLLEDHSNECVPCRRELKAQRTAMSSAAKVEPVRATERQWAFMNFLKGFNAMRWGVAAVTVVAVGLAALFAYERVDLSGRTMAATIENADGSVYVVSDAGDRQLAVGQQLMKGEHVRTARDSNAVLRLADGSSVEMRERSEFSVSENMRGVTIKLDRGDVVVEAAKQDKGRLYVQTPDSLVSVKGTIFAVESGTKGSRVSVVEGEVKVDHQGKNETLLPGDQTTTTSGLDKTSVTRSVAWSRNAAKYANLVSELTKLRTDVNKQMARPGVRYSSKFIDMVPENTVFYAALPNLSESLAKSRQIMQDRIKQNPALAEWSKGAKGEGLGMNDQTFNRIQEFGSQLGEEIVVAASMDAKGEPSGFLVLGDVKNADSFKAYLNNQLASLQKEAGNSMNLRIVEDPTTATVTDAAGSGEKKGKEELYVWVNNGIFAASPKIDSLKGLASTMKAPETNRFAASSFHQKIADVYKDGAGIVVAADLEKIVSQALSKDKSADAASRLEGFKQLGITNLRHFVAEQKDVNGKTLSQASLTFSESEKGIPSWLAAPGPMGALEFISPNANVAAAFVVKEPSKLVDDMLGFFETVDPESRGKMNELAQSQGFNIRDDFAAPLGGEFAFAIDGPLLPTPSWKVVVEVYDQAKLQNTFERAVERINQFSAVLGKGKVALDSEKSGDRTYYRLHSDKVGAEVNYTYANGYLIAAPTRALIEQTLKNRAAGNTLTHSPRFIASLPADGNANFSGLLYHDLAPLMSTIADKIKAGGTDENGKSLMQIDPNAPPTLAYMYAQGDRITLAANTEGGAFGLSPSSLIGLPNSFQMQHILMNAMGDKKGETK